MRTILMLSALLLAATPAFASDAAADEAPEWHGLYDDVLDYLKLR